MLDFHGEIFVRFARSTAELNSSVVFWREKVTELFWWQSNDSLDRTMETKQKIQERDFVRLALQKDLCTGIHFLFTCYSFHHRWIDSGSLLVFPHALLLWMCWIQLTLKAKLFLPNPRADEVHLHCWISSNLEIQCNPVNPHVVDHLPAVFELLLVFDCWLLWLFRWGLFPWMFRAIKWQTTTLWRCEWLVVTFLTSFVSRFFFGPEVHDIVIILFLLM